MAHRVHRSILARRIRRASSAWALVAAAVAQSACDGPDADRASISPTVPTRAATGVPRGDPLRDYELTLDNLRGLYHAHHNLYRLSARQPGLLERLEEEIGENPPEAFEKTVAAIGAVPAVQTALARAKITPRDFYLTQYTLMNAAAVVEARAAGRTDNLPDVSERNIEFVRQNPKDVERVMTERRPKTEKSE